MSTDIVSDRYAEFLKAIDKISDLLVTKIGSKIDLEDIITRRAALQDRLSEEYRSKPESFTKENVIEELLEFLGYDKGSRAGESELKKTFGRNYPDYKLLASQDFYLLVEAEPLNKDLESKSGGVRQVGWFFQFEYESHHCPIMKHVACSLALELSILTTLRVINLSR